MDEVQKLTQFARVDSLATPEERGQQAETMRKMLLAMVTDIRVVLIKLAMRTRTLQFLSNVPDNPEKRAVAKETLDIFAPLANRLGVWQLKWQLEGSGLPSSRAGKILRNRPAFGRKTHRAPRIHRKLPQYPAYGTEKIQYSF